MIVRRFGIAISTCIALGTLSVNAQTGGTLSITVSGTLGPVLQGSDPLHQNKRANLLLLQASESLSPTSSTADSATYSLPLGSITVSQSGVALTAGASSTMTVQLTDTADILTVTYSASPSIVNTLTAYLAPGSWDSSVLTHPKPFSPATQTLTAATVAGGPGSQSHYIDQGATTVLGVSGTAANGDAGTVTSLYGDMDCFGLPNVTACPNGSLWQSELGGVFFTDYRSPQEKASNSVTDIWAAPVNVSWTHPAYSPTGAVSASLIIKIAGMGDVGQAYSVLFDGTKIGTIHRNTNPNAFQEVVTWLIGVPVGLLTGNDHVTITTNGGDGFAIDYAQLSVTLAE